MEVPAQAKSWRKPGTPMKAQKVATAALEVSIFDRYQGGTHEAAQTGGKHSAGPVKGWYRARTPRSQIGGRGAPSSLAYL